VEPELVNWDVALLLELVRPLAAVLVLDILPFGADAFLEEMVIGLEGQFGRGSNVVLGLVRSYYEFTACDNLRRHPRIPQQS
jgi:hypothetical protein